MSSMEVCATVRTVGFHRYKNAPDAVDYLSSKHRHVFTIRVWVQVTHDDREIEFHMLQRMVRDALNGMYRTQIAGELDFKSESCEAIANSLFTHSYFVNIPINRIEVWEDDENGAIVHYGEKK